LRLEQVFTTALYYPETTATFIFRQSIDIHVFTKRFVKGHVLACNMPCLIAQYTVFCNAIRRLLECVSTKSIQSLNNEGLRYDKYHPYPTVRENGWFGLSFGLWQEKNMNP
jgi:hypothetical protein